MVCLPSLSIDIYVPVMGSMARALLTSKASIQLTISVFLAGLAIAQLFSGFIADIIGRRTTLLFGLALYSVMSLLCSFAQSSDSILYYRILQGLGCSVIVVCAFAICRDLFEGESLTKTISYITAIISLSPAIAPIIGGFIASISSWRGIFILLAITGLFLLLMGYVFLPETLNNHKEAMPTKRAKLLDVYRSLLSNTRFLQLSLLVSVIYSAYFSYLYNASFVFESIYRQTIAITAGLMGLNAFALFLGSALAPSIVKRIGTQRAVISALFTIIIFSLVLTLYHAHFHTPSLAVFCSCMFLSTFSVAIIVPLMNSESLSAVNQHFASAAAFSGFIRYGLASSFGALIASFHLISVHLITASLLVASFLGLFLLKKAGLARQ